jgi:hypothetical protein
MGLQVIAEGIEDLDQADWLLRHGCAMAQGFAFGRPAPLPTPAEVLIDELTDAPVPVAVPDAPDERLETDDVEQPYRTMPTPVVRLPYEDTDDEDTDDEDADDEVAHAPVAWGADPTEWEDGDPADEQPDEFRRY